MVFLLLTLPLRGRLPMLRPSVPPPPMSFEPENEQVFSTVYA
jgi:hypothetical protein